MNGIKEWFVAMIFFIILAILTLVTIIYAKEAEQEAREARRQVVDLNVTAQNRCIVQVILAYPSPVQETELSLVLQDFDECIQGIK